MCVLISPTVFEMQGFEISKKKTPPHPLVLGKHFPCCPRETLDSQVRRIF